MTQALLLKAGLAELVERTISIDEVRAFKPDARVYRHAAAMLGIPEASMTLVATHAWDVHGAKCAGLAAAFVARGQRFPEIFRQPDVIGETLSDVAQHLSAREAF